MKAYASGKSGTQYKFTKMHIDDDLPEDFAIYIFAEEKHDTFTPVYIGMTIHLDTRIDQHAHKTGKLQCAKENGANCLLVYLPKTLSLLSGADALRDIEKDLLAAYTTPCNERK